MRQGKGLFEALFGRISRPELKAKIILPDISDNSGTYSGAECKGSEYMIGSIDISSPPTTAFDSMSSLDFFETIQKTPVDYVNPASSIDPLASPVSLHE